MTTTCNVWVLTGRNGRKRIRHLAGHARLGYAFTRCGHPVGQAAHMNAAPCRACAAAPAMARGGPTMPVKASGDPHVPSVRQARRGRAYPGIQEHLTAAKVGLQAEAAAGDQAAADALRHLEQAAATLRGEVS